MASGAYEGRIKGRTHVRINQKNAEDQNATCQQKEPSTHGQIAPFSVVPGPDGFARMRTFVHVGWGPLMRLQEHFEPSAYDPKQTCSTSVWGGLVVSACAV
jgi:hypothetical protein